MCELFCKILLYLSFQLSDKYRAATSQHCIAATDGDLYKPHALPSRVPLIDWISDTLCQGYTLFCTACKPIGKVPGPYRIQYAVKQDYVKLHDALKYTSEATFTVNDLQSWTVELLTENLPP